MIEKLVRIPENVATILASVVSLACAGLAPMSQAQDIIDSARANPLQATSANGDPIPYGDYDLDAAERALRDGLPRPWTYDVIVPLFETAATDLIAEFDADNDSVAYWDYLDDKDALVSHLGTIIAASRDPRAALALGDWLDPNVGHIRTARFITCLENYFLYDPRYRPPPSRGDVVAATNILPILREDAQIWLELNATQLQAAAAELPEIEIPSREKLRSTIDSLIDQFEARRPRLHLVSDDGNKITLAEFDGIIRSLVGQERRTRSSQRLEPQGEWVTLRVPAMLIGEPALAIRGVVRSEGYDADDFEIPDTSTLQEITIRLGSSARSAADITVSP